MTDLLKRLTELEAKATPGKWKSWGMTMMWDCLSTSNVDDCVSIASFHTKDERGYPRTFDLDFVCALRNAWPEIKAALERAGKDSAETMNALKGLIHYASCEENSKGHPASCACCHCMAIDAARKEGK